jgi:small multidrug resistance family-3 protein
MNIKEVLISLGFFLLAGVCEIGGGYLIWQWLKEGKSYGMALVGGVILAVYGVVATMQPIHFSRAYAAYGGIFIVLSLLWGWKVDGVRPDKFDIIGGVIALIGVYVIMYAPRH